MADWRATFKRSSSLIWSATEDMVTTRLSKATPNVRGNQQPESTLPHLASRADEVCPARSRCGELLGDLIGGMDVWIVINIGTLV